MDKKTEISSCGIIERNNHFVLVYQVKTNTWAFLKGHIEENERPLDAAYREIFEETGIRDLKFISKVGKYQRSTKKSSNVVKVIHVFYFSTKQMNLNTKLDDVTKAIWVPIGKVEDSLSYEEDADFFTNVFITKFKNNK